MNLLFSKKKNKWNVTCLSSKGKYLNYLHKIGFNTKSINISRNFNLMNKIKVIFDLYKYFKREKFDFIHTHTPLVSILVRISCMFIKKTKVIYTAHGFYFHENMNFFLYNFFLYLEKILSIFTDLIFIQSKEDFKLASQKFFNKKKIFYIGNGINLKRFKVNNLNKIEINRIKKKYKIRANFFVAGMICRLVKEKGVIEFLEASYLFSKNNQNFKAILVGKRLKNEHSSSVKEIIKKYKFLMKDKLIIVGHVKNVEDYLSIFSVFCLPSYREGLPRSIIEAMSMKLPVIATNIRGCRELIRDNVNGFLVPIKNPLSIFLKMKILEKSKKIRKKMGLEGYKKVAIFHNEKKIVIMQNNLIQKHHND